MTPLRKGMFTASLKIRDGLSQWADSLPEWFRRRRGKPSETAPASSRPEPRTEGERALYQAMGWKENAWEE